MIVKEQNRTVLFGNGGLSAGVVRNIMGIAIIISSMLLEIMRVIRDKFSYNMIPHNANSYSA